MTNKKSVLRKTLMAWLPLAAVIIILTGLVYTAIQQSYRQNANDPQVQIAEDIVNAIEQGTAPDSIVPPTGTTDISKSLAPWVMIYDDSGKQLGSSAILNGKNPDYPTGVLDTVKKSGQESRVTWQPQPGVRMATVVTRYSGKVSGYVIAGRSLREVEMRIGQLTAMTAAAGALALVVSILLIFLFIKLNELKNETPEEGHEHHDHMSHQSHEGHAEHTDHHHG